MKKILCPVDFSRHSDAALNHAVEIALAGETMLHLIYVLPQPNSYDWMTGMYILIAEDTFARAKQEAGEKLNTLEAELRNKYPALNVSHVIDNTSDAADGIIAEAKKIHADLVVMGSHGRRGLDRLLMGSVAESVMRHAPCDVIIYRKK